ncbi:MAG: acyl carrier protein [Stigonema ocellatum SAG 48.90 = DSM 106950]|nr:acyl carrier protein [Stigonema ocellatum SAG 48.90 = DSM 106950]
MDTLSVMKTLKGILTDLGVEEELLHENTYLHRDLHLDSIETVELALGLKRRLGVNVKLEARHDRTLAQICNLVSETIAANSK